MKTVLSLGLFVAALVSVKSDPTSEAPTTRDGSTLGGSTVSRSPDDVRQKIKEQLAALTDRCRTATKLTPDQAKIVSNQAIPKTEPEKCFLECIYNGLNVTKDGKFVDAAARVLAQQRFATSPEELTKANSMIEVCTKEAVVKDTTEKCAIGRVVRECFVKNGAKINFFPKP